MNKIAKLLAVLVWLLVIGVIGYSYLFGQKEDPRAVIKQLVIVGQAYVEDRNIDPKGIDGSGPSYDFLRVMARQFSDKQIIERDLNSETKTLMATLSLENLSKPELLDQSIARATAYGDAVEKKRAEFKASIDRMNTEVGKLRGESEIFNVDSTIEESAGILQTHNAQGDMRLALGQYVKATLDFVKSRVGYYQTDTGRMVFSTPEDQAYYEQIVTTTNEIYKNLTDMIALERSQFREELSKIPI